MSAQPLQVVHLKVEHRHGSTYVSSEDMPGLYLWGQDPEKIFHDVPIALQELYKYKSGTEVVARPKIGEVALARHLGTEREPDIYEIFPVSSLKQDGVNG